MAKTILASFNWGKYDVTFERDDTLTLDEESTGKMYVVLNDVSDPSNPVELVKMEHNPSE